MLDLLRGFYVNETQRQVNSENFHFQNDHPVLSYQMVIFNPSSWEPVYAMHHVTFKSLPAGHLIPGLRG